MGVERHPGSLRGLSDDQLGTIAVSLTLNEVQWTPDVAPAVLDRISRDAVAYPEQFDRRSAPPALPFKQVPSGRSTRRTVTRLLVFGVLLALVVGAVAVAANAGSARAASPDIEALGLELDPVADGFDRPLFVTAAGDASGQLYVVEQAGRIQRVHSDRTIDAEPFLDLTEAVADGGERGLLGLAFHPAFADNGRFFVDYTRRDDGATVVSEFSAVEGIADSASERELLVIEQPHANHNGGMIAFDVDGYLLIGTGDGGSGGDPQGNGQNPDALLGKLLRIDVDGASPYGIPPDNGYASTDAHRPEIHLNGLRNPWRFSVDPDGGHIYIGDVGQSTWEEIDVAPDGLGGISFGWNELEGPECFVEGCDPVAHTAPTLAYGHDEGCAVVGGYAYRGTLQPELTGAYLFGDSCSGTIWGVAADAMLDGPTAARELARMDGTLASFGVDDAGEVYVVDLEGRVLHVRAVPLS